MNVSPVAIRAGAAHAGTSPRQFDRQRLPEPQAFYESQGLLFKGRGPWRTTSCGFHGGSDSMRVNVESGAFRCMACGEQGGDVLAYAMQANGWEFIDAAEKLGAMSKGGNGEPRRTLSATTALRLIQREAMVVAMTGLSIQGAITDHDERQRMLQAVSVIQNIMQEHAE